MKKASIIVAAAALAACGARPEPEIRVQRVYCLTPEQYKKLVDAEPAKIGNTLDKDARVSNKQLVNQNILVRTYANGLLDVLGNCTSPQSP